MSPNLELEEKVIRKFIEDSKQERFIKFSSNSKNRRKFRNELHSFKYFKWELFSEAKGIVSDLILNELQKK